MRIVALELDNDIKGIEQRDAYVESLVRRLPHPDFIVLPELSRCSYMASQAVWKYADNHGRSTSEWAVRLAKTYGRGLFQPLSDRRPGRGLRNCFEIGR